MKEADGRDLFVNGNVLPRADDRDDIEDSEPTAEAIEKGKLLRIEREQRLLAQSAMNPSEYDVQEEFDHQDEVHIAKEVREIIDWFNEIVLDLRSKEDKYGAKIHSLQDAQRIAYNRLNLGFRTARLAAENYDVTPLQGLYVDGAEVHTLEYHNVQKADALDLDVRQRAYKD